MTSKTPSPPLSADELEALWREAWRMARRICSGTLTRLRAGHGGFYDADDLHQDLYLDFYRLALRWATTEPRPPETDLWATWRRRLWYGGRHVYRLKPQRLWQHAEITLPPEVLALEHDDGADTEGGASRETELPPGALAQLIETETPDDEVEARERLEQLRAALDSLPEAQRRLLYYAVVQGFPHREIARVLGLTSTRAASQRVYRARRALRRAVARGKSARHKGSHRKG